MYLLGYWDSKGDYIEDISNKISIFVTSKVKNFAFRDKIELEVLIQNIASSSQQIVIDNNLLQQLEIQIREVSGDYIFHPVDFKYIPFKDLQDIYSYHYTIQGEENRLILLKPAETFSFTVFLEPIDSFILKLFVHQDSSEKILEEYYDFEITCRFYLRGAYNTFYFSDCKNNIDIRVFTQKDMFLKDIMVSQKQRFFKNKKFSHLDNYLQNNNATENSPEDVLFLALSKLKDNEWNSYFSYVIFPDFLSYSLKHQRLYQKAVSLQKKQEVLEQFYRFFCKEMRLSFPILSFKIISELKNTKENTLRFLVELERNIEGIIKKYRYVFYMKRDMSTNTYWRIVNLDLWAK